MIIMIILINENKMKWNEMIMIIMNKMINE